MSIKHATTDHPVHELIAKRWSPYAFEPKAMPASDLRSILEAARWAASSYNEQPWRYIVATRDDAEAWGRALSCLVDANAAWAQNASALLLGVANTQFSRNGKDNIAADHDLGLAAGNLSLEATARGYAVHQMIGIVPDKVRELYGVPEGYRPLTALAIGYGAPADTLPEGVRERDEAPRARNAQDAFVFGNEWGSAAGF